MRQMLLRCLSGLLLGWVLALPAAARAAQLRVRGSAAALQQAVQHARAGATVRVGSGVYHVHLRITHSLALLGSPGTVLDGDNHGDVVRVAAPHVTIRGLTIRDSGTDLVKMNAGIFVERGAASVVIADNVLKHIGFGVFVDSSPRPVIRDNRVSGILSLRSVDRGNGIHLSGVRGALVVGNEISGTRDGLYLDATTDSTLRDNYMHDLRYGIHYMYCNDNRVEHNRTYHTRTGYALMQSRGLTVVGNTSHADRNYGILMNFIVSSTIANNRVSDVRAGEMTGRDDHEVAGTQGKCLFIYNSQFNSIRGNRLEGCDIGIHLTAGSEQNQLYGNAFIDNTVQVKYVATRRQEWSYEGHGNYWSDYVGWDLNADGVGDRSYEPNDAVDKLLWKYPMARLLLNSPAVDVLRWVQQQFPVLRPQGVRDSHPLMADPTRAGRPS